MKGIIETPACNNEKPAAQQVCFFVLLKGRIHFFHSDREKVGMSPSGLGERNEMDRGSKTK